MDKSIPRGRRGFTLVEVLVTMAILVIALFLGAPTLSRMIVRSQVETSARELATLMQRARLEAIKRRVQSVVEIDPATGEAFAFADVDGSSAGDPPDLEFNPVAGELRFTTDYRIGRARTGSRVTFTAPGGQAVEAGLTPGPGSRRLAVFVPTGAADRGGAFRLGDRADANHLEVRIDPAGTGRVVLRKWDRDAGEWYEHREGGRPWAWYRPS